VLGTCPSIDDLIILTDSVDSLTTMFRLHFLLRLSLHRKHMRPLYTHILLLLNHLHATGVIARLFTVKAHCGEPLYEAADALASAAAEADWAPVTGDSRGVAS
jgi:ribonuclease HI